MKTVRDRLPFVRIARKIRSARTGGRGVFAALSLFAAVSAFAAQQAPTMALLRASRPCSAVCTQSFLVSTQQLDQAETAADGTSWYRSSGTDWVQVSDQRTFTASLTGYQTEWRSYASSPAQVGTNAATRVIATGPTVDLASAVGYQKLIETLVGDQIGRTLLYAVFTPVTYKLTYELDSGSWPSKFSPPDTATYDVAFTLKNPSKTGYSFTGWDVDGASYPMSGDEMTFLNLTVVSNATVSFTAEWARKQYALKLNVQEGVARIHYRTQDEGGDWSDWQTVTAGTQVPVSFGCGYQCYADAAYGYAASGDTGWSEMSPVSGKMTEDEFAFGPKPTKNTYKLEVLGSGDGTGGTAKVVTGTGTYGYLEKVKIEATPNNGYTFAYWSDGNTDRIRTIEVIGDRTLTAYFKAAGASSSECHIEFHSNYPTAAGKDPETETQTIEQNVPTALRANTWSVTGYTFAGWAASATATQAEYPDRDLQTWSSDQHLYAVWTPNTYEVVFDANGGTGTMAATNLTYGVEATISTNVVSLSGMTFVGWGTNNTTAVYLPEGDNTILKNLTPINGDHIKLYAIWQLTEDCGDYSRALGCLNLRWEKEGDTWKVNGASVEYESDGFSAWLYAQEKKGGHYQLQYDWMSTNSDSSVSIKVNGASHPSKKIAEEDLWGTYACDVGTSFDSRIIYIVPTGDCSLRNVRWTRVVDAHSVRFVVETNYLERIGGGALVQSVEAGHVAQAPTIVGKAGYDFTGWKDEMDSPVESIADVAITEARTFMAQWKLHDYQIIYEKLRDGAVNPNPTNYQYASTNIVFKDPTGVENFAYWSPTGIVAGTTDDQVVTAYWNTSAPTVTTNKVTISGAGDETTASVIAGNTIVLKVPKTRTVEGTSYPCKGWEGTGSIPSGTVDDTTPVDGQGNYVLEYQIAEASSITWLYLDIPQPKVYRDVTFELGDCLTRTGGGALEQSVEDGHVASVPTVKAASGYAFAGWAYEDADLGQVVTNDSETVAELAITADTIFTGCVTNLPRTKFDVTVSVADGCEKMGTVSGAKANVKPGTKVTVKASAKTGFVFAGWCDAAAEEGEEERWLSRSASYALTMPAEDVSLVAKFLAKSEDWASVAVGAVADEYAKGVAIDPIAVTAAGGSLPTVKVTGLPSGLKYTAAVVTAKKTETIGGKRVTTLVTNALPNTIYGTPTKSGVYTATVTATTLGKATASTNVTFVVADRAKGEQVVRSDVALIDADGSPIPSETLPGKTTGQGVYAAGKKVTLKATANKGYVFSGWYDASTLVSRLASLALTVPDKDIAYTAAFVTTATDAANISANVNGATLIARGEETASVGLTVSTNVSVGVYLEWPVAADALSAATVAVSGLPSGLKFTAKPVTTRVTAKVGGKSVTTVVTNVPAMTIYGTPTAASKTDRFGNVVPSQVKVTVTTVGRNKATGILALTVDALPTALVGTFAGGSTNEPTGSASVTLAKTGRISGKWISEGKTWTLTATGFDFLGAGEAFAEYVATNVTVKSGTLVDTLMLVFSENDQGYGTVFAYEADALVDAGPCPRQDAPALFSAAYVPWKTDAALKVLAGELRNKAFLAEPEEGVALTGKVSANGVVSVAGAFDIGAAKPYTATVKGTLVPLGEDEAGNERFELFLYWPPKANKFDGYAVRLNLVWNGATLE